MLHVQSSHFCWQGYLPAYQAHLNLSWQMVTFTVRNWAGAEAQQYLPEPMAWSPVVANRSPWKALAQCLSFTQNRAGGAGCCHCCELVVARDWCFPVLSNCSVSLQELFHYQVVLILLCDSSQDGELNVILLSLTAWYAEQPSQHLLGSITSISLVQSLCLLRDGPLLLDGF